ncbi:hypothetical protein OAN61_00235 [bacterium]|nr:hypothetical protein [bacterium]
MPAGTPVKASHNGTVSFFEHQKILPESAINTTPAANWVGGAELHFRITSSHSRWWAPNLSKLLVTMSVNKHGGGGAPPISTRLVTCPVSQLFSSVRCSINGVSVESKASHYGLLSQFQTRTNVSKSAGKTAGSGGLLDFEDHMCPLDGTLQADFPAPAGNATIDSVSQNRSRRNRKQDLLQIAAGGDFEISEGINLDVLSSGMWCPGCQVDLYLLVNPKWQEDLLFSELVIPDVAVAITHTSGAVALETAAAKRTTGAIAVNDLASGTGASKPVVHIKKVELLALFASPISGILRPPSNSLQSVYDSLSYQERKLTSSSFEEVIVIPPGVRAVCVWSREDIHSITFDNGRFGAAGGGNAAKGVSGVVAALANVTRADSTNHRGQQITSLQCRIGGISAPTTMYSGLDFRGQKAQRVYDAAQSFLNNSLATEASALDCTEFMRSPIFYLHTILPPGVAATTLTVQGTLEGTPAAGSTQQLCVCTIHSRMLEMKWADAASEFPSTVTVQPIL